MPTRPQQLLEGLVGSCRIALSTDKLPASGGHRPQVMVTIDYQDLVQQIGTETGTETGTSGQAVFGGLITPATVRKMACDADLIPIVFGGKGEVLDVGRAQRLFTPAQLRALVARDKGCAFPGCTMPAHWTEAHHIRYWKKHKGRTSVANGVLLCSFHHHLIHAGDWTIETIDGIPWFIPPAYTDPSQVPRRNHYRHPPNLKRAQQPTTPAPWTDGRSGNLAGPPLRTDARRPSPAASPPAGTPADSPALARAAGAPTTSTHGWNRPSVMVRCNRTRLPGRDRRSLRWNPCRFTRQIAGRHTTAREGGLRPRNVPYPLPNPPSRPQLAPAPCLKAGLEALRQVRRRPLALTGTEFRREGTRAPPSLAVLPDCRRRPCRGPAAVIESKANYAVPLSTRGQPPIRRRASRPQDIQPASRHNGPCCPTL
ncbi:HNH endonuclease signature motif containing protein [Arthrobacter mangrovi]|uniref:HNH endonuclease signature motif containing protein n=1 Tax=Arthrobacter mangrovi TaxID=2966350 RepID=UPI00222E4F7B|nr:DUF222 domain-containing protein [Arthrobacter mangrovi]